MRSAMLVLLAVALGVNGQCFGAQDATRRALAEELLNEMQMKENLEKSFTMMKKMMPQFAKMGEATMKNAAPADENKKDVEEKAAKADVEAFDKWANNAHTKVFDEVAKEMTWDNMKDDYITLYAETYTEEELRGLVDFYKSPIGRAFIEKQPELMKRSMELMQKRMVQWMPKFQALTKEITKEMMESSHKKAEEAVPPTTKPPVPPAVQPPQSSP